MGLGAGGAGGQGESSFFGSGFGMLCLLVLGRSFFQLVHAVVFF